MHQQLAAQRATGVRASKILGAKASRIEQSHGQRIPHREGGGCAGGRREAQRRALGWRHVRPRSRLEPRLRGWPVRRARSLHGRSLGPVRRGRERVRLDAHDVELGDSIALNGACMTITSFDAAAARFTIDISAESLSKTAGLAEPGPVNLEKALRAHDRLGGRSGLAQGHT